MDLNEDEPQLMNHIGCEHGCRFFKDGKISIQCDKAAAEKAAKYRKAGYLRVGGNNPTNFAIIKLLLFEEVSAAPLQTTKDTS